MEKEIKYSKIDCQNCGEKLIIRTDKFGARFLGCRNFRNPLCAGFFNMDGETIGELNNKVKTEITYSKTTICQNCGEPAIVRQDRNGNEYFECRYDDPNCKDFMTKLNECIAAGRWDFEKGHQIK